MPPVKTRTIEPAVLNVLAESTVKGNILLLPPGNLERELYLQLDKVIKNLGGKWNRSAKGHVFATESETSLQEKLAGAVATGEFIRLDDHGFFPTPPELVSKLIRLAELQPGCKVLEPSAGTGNIAAAAAIVVGAANVRCIELLPDNVEALHARGLAAEQADFLQVPVAHGAFDRIIMNPPFARQQDIDHVHRAWQWLKPGGTLVSVMSAGVTFRDNAKARAFNELRGEFETACVTNPAGSFKESGTGVNTVSIVMEKPANYQSAHGEAA